MKLIDADKLKKAIQVICGTDSITTVEHIIDAVPTAYDIDWVVDQLEKFKELECGDTKEDIELYELGRSQGKLEAYLNAIEIVKEGGVPDEESKG